MYSFTGVALMVLLCLNENGMPLPLVTQLKSEATSVLTKYGTIFGFNHLIGVNNVGEKTTADVYLGIPFAKPPIGKLRFEKPMTPEKFENNFFNASKFSSACASVAPNMEEPEFSEDCLYLNVITPTNRNSTEKLPVVVWIHGGAFSAGSAKMYGYEALAANFASRGIVVVTIQYRLGMFGFFTTGDKTMGGNYGIWDQRAALIWINENIADFGGDNMKITLWGQNSGAASIGALSVSKWTRDLFAQAIEMSGSMFAGWANSKSVVKTSQKLAKYLDCPLTVSSKIKSCIKSKTLHEISIAAAKMDWKRDDLNFVRWQMHLDEEFFGKDLESLLAEAPRKRTIQGVNSQESMLQSKLICFFYYYYLALPFAGITKDSSIVVTKDRFSGFGREEIVKFIQEKVVPDELFKDAEEREQVRAELIAFYADRNVSDDADARFYLTRYTQILSDIQFNIPTLMEVWKKSRLEWPVYLYLINYMNPKYDFPVYGTLQTYEFSYLFGISLVGPLEFDEKDRKVQRVMVNALTNFIKSGNPSSNLGVWPAVTEEHPFGFFDMQPEPVLRDNLMLDRTKFWSQMIQRYSFDLVRDFNKLTGIPKNEF